VILITIATTLRFAHLRARLADSRQSVFEIDVPAIVLNFHFILRAGARARVHHRGSLQVARGEAEHLFALTGVDGINRHRHDAALLR
jgi:hypothetical protein